MQRASTPWEDLALAEDLMRGRSRDRRLARLGGRAVRAWPSRLMGGTVNAVMIASVIAIYVWLEGWWRVAGFVGVFAISMAAYPKTGWALRARFLRARTRAMHDAPCGEALALHALLDARRAWWQSQIDGVDASRLRRHLLALQWGYTSVLSVFLMGLASLSVEVLLQAHSQPAATVTAMRSLWLFVYTAAMWTFIITMHVVNSRRRERIRRALTRNTCVACGYDLSSLRAASDPPGRVLRGPQRCPECGCVWPLVPPPVPLAPS